MADDDEEPIHIKPYPLIKLSCPNMRCLIIGMSGAGKTVAMYYMLAAIHGVKHRVRRVLGFAKSEEANGVLGGKVGQKGIMPKLFAHYKFEPEILSKFFLIQKACAKRNQNKEAIVVLDDLMCDKKVVACPATAELCMNGRQYDVGVIATAHGVKQLGPDIRNMFEVIIAFDMAGEAEKLYKVFFTSVFRNFKEFEECYLPIVKAPPLPGQDRRRRAIVLDRRAPGGRIQDQVFTFEVPMEIAMGWTKKDAKGILTPTIPLPRLGSANKWRVSERVVKDDIDDIKDPFDMGDIAANVQMLRGGGSLGMLPSEAKPRKGRKAPAKARAPGKHEPSAFKFVFGEVGG